jgi:hypothetical protein
LKEDKKRDKGVREKEKRKEEVPRKKLRQRKFVGGI